MGSGLGEPQRPRIDSGRCRRRPQRRRLRRLRRRRGGGGGGGAFGSGGGGGGGGGGVGGRGDGGTLGGGGGGLAGFGGGGGGAPAQPWRRRRRLRRRRRWRRLRRGGRLGGGGGFRRRQLCGGGGLGAGGDIFPFRPRLAHDRGRRPRRGNRHRRWRRRLASTARRSAAACSCKAMRRSRWRRRRERSKISGVIADQSGLRRTAQTPAPEPHPQRRRTLDLTAANTFSGGTTIDKGVLRARQRRAPPGVAVSDSRRPAAGSITPPGSHLANTISGFGGTDKIDFSKVAFTARDHAVDNSGTVSIETAAGVTVATFKVSGTYTSANFHVAADTSGHVLVTYVATGAPAASGPAIASPADLLGGYGADFARRPGGPATCRRSIPGPRSRWARGPTTAFSASTMRITATPAPRTTPGASLPAGTARPVTGLGLARDAGRLGVAAQRMAGATDALRLRAPGPRR